ncbi:MAG: hypothetical protein HOP25_04135 [Methylotenera sp.]|nr:hypothetical protein [Methylotenera sp.]
MTNDIQKKLRAGTMIALGAAALIQSGLVFSAEKTMEAKIHCVGINACKGTSDCKTANNACKGQNICKGIGFTSTTAKDCAAKGGMLEKPAVEK